MKKNKNDVTVSSTLLQSLFFWALELFALVCVYYCDVFIVINVIIAIRFDENIFRINVSLTYFPQFDCVILFFFRFVLFFG